MTWMDVSSKKSLSGGMNVANLWGKEVRHFFQAKQDAANGGSECHSDTRSTCGAEYLSPLACVECWPGDKGRGQSRRRTFVVFILGKVTTNNISDTACYVHKRTFLAEVETRCDGESQTNGLGEESATSEVTMYNKTCRYKLSSKKKKTPKSDIKHTDQKGWFLSLVYRCRRRNIVPGVLREDRMVARKPFGPRTGRQNLGKALQSPCA